MQGWFLNNIRYLYEKFKSYLNVYPDAYEGVTSNFVMNTSEDLSWPLV